LQKIPLKFQNSQHNFIFRKQGIRKKEKKPALSILIIEARHKPPGSIIVKGMSEYIKVEKVTRADLICETALIETYFK